MAKSKIPHIEIKNPNKLWSPCHGEGCQHPSHKSDICIKKRIDKAIKRFERCHRQSGEKGDRNENTLF